MAEFKHSNSISETNTNPVDAFEQSFQACLSAMTKEDTLSNLDRDEIKVDAELTLQNFIDSARSMEGYFLKKRLQIAAQKPELLVKDDTSELRLEMMRKDELLKKNFEKMGHWQSILADLQSSIGVKPGIPGTNPTTSAIGPSGPLTPISGRPQTPASVGRPQTPISTSGQINTGISNANASNSRMLPSPNVGYQSPMSQGMQQQQQSSGLQGPLAYLEKTASTIGMNENR